MSGTLPAGCPRATLIRNAAVATPWGVHEGQVEPCSLERMA